MKLLTFRAADQDGYDGGWIAKNGNNEAWGETEAEALKALAEKIFGSEFAMSVEKRGTQLTML